MAKMNVVILVLAIFFASVLTGVAYGKHSRNLKLARSGLTGQPASVMQACVSVPDDESEEESSCPAVASVFDP
ncbi:MAG: hypothetical protein KGJ15_01895 [Betaproteobacteria bacterium]|nr:hypothetical protein [Betaproteobacteria bacterium]MDE2624629.1 hypothetical protein [Betaproteobacteria bacterium]